MTTKDKRKIYIAGIAQSIIEDEKVRDAVLASPDVSSFLEDTSVPLLQIISEEGKIQCSCI